LANRKYCRIGEPGKQAINQEEAMSRDAIIDVGIDVSARTLDLALKHKQQLLYAQFENSPSGHKAILRYIAKRSEGVRSFV